VSVAKAQRLLLGRLAAGETALLAFHLATSGDGWADGTDAEGRAVYLVGAHALRQLPEGAAAVTAVLAALAAGYMPEAVHGVAYAPAASAAWQTVVMTDAEQVLIDGPRGTGKTQLTPALWAGLAEQHARAGYPLPFTVLWLHTSLTNGRAKTIPSLEQAHWGGSGPCAKMARSRCSRWAAWSTCTRPLSARRIRQRRSGCVRRRTRWGPRK
jgi:hypothetical protein